MDLYVPRWRAHRVVQCLRGLGFVPVSKTAIMDTYQPTSAITSVTKLTDGHKLIDIIKSSSKSPFHPIFKFHLTAIMKFMSCDGFFSAYPMLTTKHQSLKNPIPYICNEPLVHTLPCYKKYKACGFNLAFNTKRWGELEGRTHHWQSSWCCPHTIWSTYNAGCLFVPFHRFAETEKDAEGCSLRCFIDRQVVVWHLGGETCEDWYEPLHLFRTTIGAFTYWLYKTFHALWTWHYHMIVIMKDILLAVQWEVDQCLFFWTPLVWSRWVSQQYSWRSHIHWQCAKQSCFF